MGAEIWVAGYPSFVGGADTELDHLIDLWRLYDVEVNLVPMFGIDAKMRTLCEERDCKTHNYHPAIFKDKIVVSLCNDQFLKHLSEIYEKGAPRAVVWMNCMTWTFDPEIEAHKNGLITHFAFQSQYQRDILVPQFLKHNEVNVLDGYRAFFNPERIKFTYNPPMVSYNMGRISRDDPAKFSEDMWRIFAKVCSPLPTKSFVLGYSERIEKEKTGPPAEGLDYQWWTAGAIPVHDLYRRLHCVIHKTGGSRENWCRVVLEGAAYGVPVIAERDYGMVDMIIDGETGWLCDSSDEMAFRASQMAFDEPLRERICRQARDHLETALAGAELCWKPWERLFEEMG